MYNYAATDSILDGVSNIYLVSIATAFLAVIIAFYCSNFLKDESEKQQKEIGEDELEEDHTTTTDDMENQYQLKEEIQSRLNQHGYDECDSDDVDGNDTEEESVHTDGLVGKLKSKRAKELEGRLTKDQLEEERRIEREQLSAIFELLKKQEAELNMKEIDESELNAQLSLYR